MGRGFSILMGAMIAAAVVAGGTLIATSGKVDHATEANVKELTSAYVTDIQTTGVCTEQKDSEYVEKLKSLGDFSREVEISHLNENPGKKSMQTETDKIGENVYYTEYTSQYEENLSKNDKIVLNKGDQVKVTVTQNTQSMSDSIKSSLYKISGRDTAKTIVSQSAMVTVDGK